MTADSLPSRPIIFSIGYARDESGKFLMNFGPLSQVGGERRLNVAVTRARYQLKLVDSIMPTVIDADRISSEGPKLLRTYMDFAIRGSSVLFRKPSSRARRSIRPLRRQSANSSPQTAAMSNALVRLLRLQNRHGSAAS